MKILSTKSGTFSQTDLALRQSASNWYRTYCICLHMAATLAVLATPDLPIVIAVPTLLFVLVNGWRMVDETRVASTVHWQANNIIRITMTRSARQLIYAGSVSLRSMHCRFFILLMVHQNDEQFHYHLVPRDSVSERDYRRLRSRLFLNARTNTGQTRRFKQ